MKPSIQDLINHLELVDDEKSILQQILVGPHGETAVLTTSIFSGLITILQDENCPSSMKIDLFNILFTTEQFAVILEVFLNNSSLATRMLSLGACFNEEGNDYLSRKEVIELLSDHFKRQRIPPYFYLDLSLNKEFNYEEISTLGNSLRLFPLPENIILNLSLTNLLEIVFDILEKPEITKGFMLVLNGNTIYDMSMIRLGKALSQLCCSNFSLEINSVSGKSHKISDRGFLSLLEALEFNNKIKKFTFSSYLDTLENYMVNNSPTSLGERWFNLLYANPNLNITFTNWEQLNNLNIQNQRFAAMGHQNGEELSTAIQELLTLTADHPRALLNFTRWLVIHADLDDIERNTFYEVINEIVNKVLLPLNIKSELYTLTRATWLADAALNQYELTIQQWLEDHNFKLYCRNLVDGSFSWLTSDEEFHQTIENVDESCPGLENIHNFEDIDKFLNLASTEQKNTYNPSPDLDNIGEEIKNFINLIIGYNKECIPYPPISQQLIDLIFPFRRNLKNCAVTSTLLEPIIARHYLSNIQNLAQTLEKIVPKTGAWAEASNQQEASTSTESLLGKRSRENSNSASAEEKKEELFKKISKINLGGDTSNTIWDANNQSMAYSPPALTPPVQRDKFPKL